VLVVEGEAVLEGEGEMIGLDSGEGDADGDEDCGE
jgi:hypothetical protein